MTDSEFIALMRGIAVHDHVIVGARACASMRSLGLL